MKSDIKEIQKRAVEIKEKYAEIEPKKWSEEQIFMGMLKMSTNFRSNS